MKQITMILLNQIKDCDNIIDLEKDKYRPNSNVILDNEKLKYDLIKDYSEDEQQQLIDNIKWYNDDCAFELIRIGWEVI